ncbi:MAG: hypothetical protein ACOYXT_23885 [Bacteroidota bacterium]
MRFLLFFVTFWVVAFTQPAFTQDGIVLINGDTLEAQVIKVGKGQLTIKEGVLERELNSLYVSKVLPSNGKKLVIREIPENLDFQPNLLVVKYTAERASEIAITFPNAIKREFKTVHYDAYKELPDEYFTAEGSGITGSGSELAEDYCKFMGYACNAFLVIVSQTEDGAKYIFYSNPVSAERINNTIIGKSYKLVKSEVSASNSARFLLDMAAKPFTMKMNGGGECIFKQGNKESMLQYQVTEDSKMIFADPKFSSLKPTTYEIVFINDQYMRYTQFIKEDQVVTRKVEAFVNP